jgi:tight adherence protein B
VTVALISVVVGVGLSLLARAAFGSGQRLREHHRQRALLAELQDPRPVGESTPSRDPRRAFTEAAVDLAANALARFDPKGALAASLERARIPVRPGEYVVVSAALSFIAAAFVLAVTHAWALVVLAVILCAAGSSFYVRRRVRKTRTAFEDQLPGALSLIASSMSAGHTFLRAIQMMCEESDPPLADEFAQVVAETRLGDPLVSALQRMAERVAIRDVDWIVQAIRIQQTVGGRLAEVLHTLADFIRSRDEVRREVSVLTAEGRMSAWVLASLAPFLILMIQVVNPGYLAPLLQGWGLITLGLSGASIVAGILVIFRMVRIDV